MADQTIADLKAADPAKPGQPKPSPPPAGGAGPIDLDAAQRLGAVWAGEPIATISGVTASGRRFRFDLPTAAIAPAEDPATLDPEAAVLKVLARLPVGERMTGRALADAVELTYGGGRFNSLMSRLCIPGGPVDSHRAHGYCLRRT